MKDRVSKYPGRIKLTDVETGQSRIYDLERADEPTQIGTSLSAANLLTKGVAEALGLPETDPTLNDAFRGSATRFARATWVQTGEYTGNGSYGKDSPNKLKGIASGIYFGFVISLLNGDFGLINGSIYGVDRMSAYVNGSYQDIVITDGGNGDFYFYALAGSARSQLNIDGYPYQYVLFQAQPDQISYSS